MTRVAPDIVVDDWLEATQGQLIDTPPAYVRAAAEKAAAEREIEGQHWLDATMGDIDRIIAASSQLELALPKMTQRALARDRFAKFWHDVVAPFALTPKESTIHEKLKIARKAARIGVLPNGKQMLQWDEKAGLPLYDPDDARDEANRLLRKNVPRLMELLERPGHRAYYLCGTHPNSARGELAGGMRRLYRQWNSLMRACKRKKNPAFPIVGAVAVMESPLGRFRDWHPHLNIIVVCNGWLDFKELRKRWHWDMEMRELDGHQSSIERAFREIIKYACRTVSDKSLAKSREGDVFVSSDTNRDANTNSSSGRSTGFVPGSLTGQAPAMIDWTAAEVLEYHRAHQRFRRTRSYREFFGLKKPLPLDRTGLQWSGWKRWDDRAKCWRVEWALLDSIPGDKSTPEKIRQSFLDEWRKLLGPPGQLARARAAAESIARTFGPVSLAV